MGIGRIDSEYAIREGWARDSDDEIYMDGYNAFIQVTTCDGTSGFQVKNDIGAVAFSSKSDGDGYVAKKLGIGTYNPVSILDVIGQAQMLGFKLPTDPYDGYVLVTNSDGVGTWQSLAGADGYSIFGNGLLFVVSEDVSATTSTNYQLKVRLTTPSLEGGTYMIQWSSEALSPSGNNKNTQMRIQLDDTTTLGEPLTEEETDYAPIAGFIIVALSGVHTVDMDWKRVGKSGTSRVRRSRLIMWRVT